MQVGKEDIDALIMALADMKTQIEAHEPEFAAEAATLKAQAEAWEAVHQGQQPVVEEEPDDYVYPNQSGLPFTPDQIAQALPLIKTFMDSMKTTTPTGAPESGK